MGIQGEDGFSVIAILCGLAIGAGKNQRFAVTVSSEGRCPLQITQSGAQALKRVGGAISLVFSGERYFHAPCGAGSLEAGKRSGCVFQPPGRTISEVSYAISRYQYHRVSARVQSPRRSPCFGNLGVLSSPRSSHSP